MTPEAPGLASDGASTVARGKGPVSVFDVFGSSVQRESVEVSRQPAPRTVANVAARGVSGPGSQLPHLPQIQASFGRHDVSAIHAHQGSASANAAVELGATGYAFGGEVAFGSPPDLHTAAHEAAHVVQQRGGVQLKGGIDQPGDPYEQHADAVADAVIAGRPADHLLDQVADGSGNGATAVQRKGDSAPATPGDHRHTMELYLAANRRAIWAQVGEHARSVSFPDPVPRLSWTNQHAFVCELLMQLEGNIGDFTPLAKLDEILYPSDAARTVGALLPSTDAWSPAVGLAIAHELQIAVVSSLHRLGSRYLAVVDSTGAAGEGAISPGSLVYSMPLDRYVGAALCTPHTLTVAPPDPRSAATAKDKAVALRPVKLAWEGARDPRLWNWVRATEPVDATAEEVAAAIWTVTDHHGEINAAFNAYLLAAAPPLFGIPKRFAIKNPSARQHAPADALRRDDSVDAELADVAASSAADGIALHQAAPVATPPAHGKAASPDSAPDLGTLRTLLDDCHLQLGFMASEAARWGLTDRITPAAAFVTRKQSELATVDAKALSDWSRVISGQRERLFQISGAMHNLTSTAAQLGIKDPSAPEATPVREILELLATAGGTSQFAETSQAKLHEALGLQSGLNVRALQAGERDLVSAHAEFGATMAPKQAANAVGFSREVASLQDRSRQLETTMIDGGEVDAAELDEVTLRSGEIALRERVLGTIHSTFELQSAAVRAKEGVGAHIAMLFSGKFRNLEGLCQHIRDRVVPVQDEMMAAEQRFHSQTRTRPSTAEQKGTYRAARRAVLTRGQATFVTISADEDLRHFFREGAKLVEDQQFHTACINAAALIGIAVLAAATGGAAAELAGGALMNIQGAATVAELSTVARVGMTAANVVADSAVNAVGQTVMQGGSLKQAFAENLFMSFASSVLFGAISRAAARFANAEGREAMIWAKATTFAEKAGVAVKEAGAITVHTVWGAAIGYVSHRIVRGHEPSPMEARDWLLQGASVAIGRSVHKALGERMPGIERLAKRHADAKRLVLEAQQLQQLATTVEQSKDAASAVELLDRRSQLLHDEIDAIERIVAKDGDTSGELGNARKDLEGQLHESNAHAMFETKLHLLGLEELVPGALWTGSREQIISAVESARHAGVRGDAKPPHLNGHTWRFDLDGRPLELVERTTHSPSTVAGGGPPKGSQSHEGPAAPGSTTSHDISNGVPDREVPPHEQNTQKISDSAKLKTRRLTLAAPHDEFAEAAKMVLPEAGVTDVVVHGSPNAFLVFHNGKWVSLTPNSLRTWLRKQGYEGGPIRLLSCEAGAHDQAIAQSIANGLGVDVKAPSDAIWVHENGIVTIGPTSDVNNGKWITFKPRKNQAHPVEGSDGSPPSETTVGESRTREPTTASPVSGGRQDRRDRGNRLKDKSRQLRKDHDAEDANDIAGTPSIDEIRTIPVGMKPEQFQRFGDALHRGLAEIGVHDAVAVVQGSGMSNRSYTDGTRFDEGRVSDYDVALVSPTLLKRATEFHIRLKGPLGTFELDLLGLITVRDQLSNMTERPVNFLLVRDTDVPTGIVVP